MVHDAANETKFKFVLADSLSQAASCQLLIGYKVHVTKNVKPEPNQMRGNCVKVANIFVKILVIFKTHFCVVVLVSQSIIVHSSEYEREDYQNCSVLYCVTIVHSCKHTDMSRSYR